MRMRFAMLVEGAVSDAKKKLLQDRYKLTPEILELIEEVKADDSFFEWLCRGVSKKEITLPEDTEKIAKQLEMFSKLRNSPKFKAEHPTDILKYTPSKLFETLEAATGMQSGKETKRQIHEGEIEGAQLLYNQDNWRVYKITSGQAAVVLGSGSNWCTTQIGTAENYLKRGPLFIFRFNDAPFAQLHPQSGAFMDRRDRSLREGSTLRDSVTYDIITRVEDLDPDIKSFAEKMLPLVHPSEKFLQMVKNRPASVLIELLGKVQIERYPVLEPRIFEADAPPDIAQAYFNGFADRDPEVEKHIVDKPNWAAAYAIYVLKSEWPAAEKAIKKSKLSGDYLKLLGHGTEKSDRKINFTEFMKLLRAGGVHKRFPEFEPSMIKGVAGNRIKDSEILQYCRINKFWWPEAIPVLGHAAQLQLATEFKQPLSPDLIFQMFGNYISHGNEFKTYFKEVPEAIIPPEKFEKFLDTFIKDWETSGRTDQWNKPNAEAYRTKAAALWNNIAYLGRQEPKDLDEVISLLSSGMPPETVGGKNFVTDASLAKLPSLTHFSTLLTKGYLTPQQLLDFWKSHPSEISKVATQYPMGGEAGEAMAEALKKDMKNWKPKQLINLAVSITDFLPVLPADLWDESVWRRVFSSSTHRTKAPVLKDEKILAALQKSNTKHENVSQEGVYALLDYEGPHLSEETLKAIADNTSFEGYNSGNSWYESGVVKAIIKVLTNYPEITTLGGRKSKDVIKSMMKKLERQ